MINVVLKGRKLLQNHQEKLKNHLIQDQEVTNQNQRKKDQNTKERRFKSHLIKGTIRKDTQAQNKATSY